MLKALYETNAVTHKDIPLFLEAFKVHLPFVRYLTGKDDNLVFCAEFKKADSRLLSVVVKIYRSEPVTTIEVIWRKHVPVMQEWMLKKHLWFKMNRGEPEVFIEYLDAYMEDFKVNHEMPIAAFNVTV